MSFKPREIENRLDKNTRIKLTPGAPLQGVVRGEPYIYREHYLPAKKFGVDCVGDQCPHCEEGNRSKFRFRVNFILRENPSDPQSKYVAKVLEQGSTLYDQIAAMQVSGYDLENHAIQISRSGSTKEDTTYSALPVPKGELSEEKKKILSQVPLHDLKPKAKEAINDSFDKDADEAIPF